MVDLKTVGSAINFLAPPPERGTHETKESHIWKWRIFLAVIALGGGFILHVTLACGWLPGVYAGFAEAGDLKQLVASVQADRAQVLEEAMLAINEKYCTAQPGSETRKLYLRLILERQKNYFELKNRRFDLPGCGDI